MYSIFGYSEKNHGLEGKLRWQKSSSSFSALSRPPPLPPPSSLSPQFSFCPTIFLKVCEDRVCYLRIVYVNFGLLKLSRHCWSDQHLPRSSFLRIQQHRNSCSFLWSWCIVLRFGKDCSDTHRYLDKTIITVTVLVCPSLHWTRAQYQYNMCVFFYP